MSFRCNSENKVIFLLLLAVDWVGEVGVVKLTLKLSQLPTKLKFKLILAIYKIKLGAIQVKVNLIWIHRL